MCLFWLLALIAVGFVLYCGWLVVAALACLWVAFKNRPRKNARKMGGVKRGEKNGAGF